MNSSIPCDKMVNIKGRLGEWREGGLGSALSSRSRKFDMCNKIAIEALSFPECSISENSLKLLTRHTPAPTTPPPPPPPPAPLLPCKLIWPCPLIS